MPKKILLVEDEALIAMNEAQMLENYGYEVVIVHSGAKAIQTVASDPEISLILMDIDLGSGMDGTEVAEEILKKKDIPVVFLSSHTEPEVVKKTEKITSYGYVVKNSGATVLDVSIKMAFKLYEAYIRYNKRNKELCALAEELEESNEELTRVEEDLIQQNALLESIINGTPDILAIQNLDLTIERYNEAGYRMLGKTPDEVKGKKCYELIGLKSECKGCATKRALQSKKIETLEKYIPEKEIYLDCRSYPVLDEDGKVVQIVEQLRDITERKRAEERLKEREKLINSIFRSAPAGIGLVVDRIVKSVNSRLCELTGFEEKELLDQSARILYPSDKDFDFVGSEKYAQIKESGTGSVETHWQKKDGTVIDVLLSSTPVDLEDRSKGVTFTAIDITERKQMEEALRESEEKHRRLFETSILGIVYQAADSTIISANPAAGKILGLSQDQMIGKKSGNPQWTMIRENGSTVPVREQPAWVALRTGQPIGPLVRGVFHPEKNIYIWLSITAIPQFKKGEKTPYQVYTAFEDITERKQAEDNLREALKEKDFLMKELNHRVKNNLLMVSSLISLKNSEIEVDLSDVQHQIEAIGLIHEKLYQAGKVTEICCRDYFDDLLNSIFSSFSRRPVKIEADIEEIPIPAKAAMSLGLIVNEAATNAIKHGFSESKDAVFSIKMEKDQEHNQYELTLSNTGNPFPEDIDLDNPQTLGLRLISVLTAQLDGVLKLKRDPEPVFTIQVPAGEG